MKLRTIVVQEDELQEIINGCIEQAVKRLLPELKESLKDVEEELLTKAQAAKFLKCAVSTVDNMRRSNKITTHWIGKSVRISKKEILQLIENKKK